MRCGLPVSVNWRTQGRTDRMLIARPRLHFTQRGKNVHTLWRPQCMAGLCMEKRYAALSSLFFSAASGRTSCRDLTCPLLCSMHLSVATKFHLTNLHECETACEHYRFLNLYDALDSFGARQSRYTNWMQRITYNCRRSILLKLYKLSPSKLFDGSLALGGPVHQGG